MICGLVIAAMLAAPPADGSAPPAQTQDTNQLQGPSSTPAPGRVDDGAQKAELQARHQTAAEDAVSAAGHEPCTIEDERCEQTCTTLSGSGELECKLRCKKFEVSCRRHPDAAPTPQGRLCARRDDDCRARCQLYPSGGQADCRDHCDTSETSCEEAPAPNR